MQLTSYPQDYFGDEPRRPPIDTHHPAIRTHPVTGLKSLNVNLAYCTGFAELKKAESDALMQFLNLLIHSSDDHYVRWKWQPGSIALWDNVKTSQQSRRKLLLLTNYIENMSASYHTRPLRHGYKERY